MSASRNFRFSAVDDIFDEILHDSDSEVISDDSDVDGETSHIQYARNVTEYSLYKWEIHCK